MSKKPKNWTAKELKERKNFILKGSLFILGFSIVVGVVVFLVVWL